MQKIILTCFLLAFFSTGSCQEVAPEGAPDDPFASLANWQKLTSIADPHLRSVFWKQTSDCYFGLLQDPSSNRLAYSFRWVDPAREMGSWSVNFFDRSGHALPWKQGSFLTLRVTRKVSGNSASPPITDYVIGNYYDEGASLPEVGKVVLHVAAKRGGPGRDTLRRVEFTRAKEGSDWTMETKP